MSFKDLGLSDPILKTLKRLDYLTPTEIQTKTIPLILSGKNILASAKTGSGKTAGFVLPILEKLRSLKSPKNKNANALIVTPTRELTAQIQQNVLNYGRNMSITSTSVYGGVKIFPQKNKLKNGVGILVATPGRLLDLMNQKAIFLSSVEILVLDEADLMLDMGFLNDIKKILRQLPQRRQNLMFSATFSTEIRSLAKNLNNNLIEVMTASSNSTVESVAQKIYAVDKENKSKLLCYLINEYRWSQVLVFSRTKHGTEKIAKQLNKFGIKAITIHGNKSQNARMRALKDFKSLKAQVLVATDVAARGIDVNDLPYVVNYDLPAIPNDYVHRIGRTGRAGKEGNAISFFSADDGRHLKAINQLTKLSLRPEVLEGFEPSFDLNKPIKTSRSPSKGKKKSKRYFGKARRS